MHIAILVKHLYIFIIKNKIIKKQHFYKNFIDNNTNQNFNTIREYKVLIMLNL